MRIRILQKNPYAASEIIGALILVVIAVAAAVVIYNQMLPVPLPTPEPNVHLRGYVTEQGNIIIEHMGGDTLYTYEVYVNGSFYAQNPANTPFSIGDKIGPLSSMLYDEQEHILVSVYTKKQDGINTLVFEGRLAKPTQSQTGNSNPSLPDNPLTPLLQTTLKTNTVDEDIICYADPQNTNQTTQTYIYNWTKNNNPFTKLIYAFDGDQRDEIKDYSGNTYHGIPTNLTYHPQGIIGGSYEFNQSSYISLPTIFSNPYINSFTVETWIKTTQNSSSLISFNHARCFELALAHGKPTLSTHANGHIHELIATQSTNNGIWRHIAASYNHETGIGKLYIDGLLQESAQAHNAGSSLGDGISAEGYIGKGDSGTQEEFFSTSFETTQELNHWKEDEETWGGGEGIQQGKTYIFDDFSDGTYEGWTVFSGSWTAANGFLEGSGSISAPAVIDRYPLSAYGRWEYDFQMNSDQTNQHMRMHFIQINNADSRYSSGYYVIVTGRNYWWDPTGQINLWRWDNGNTPTNSIIGAEWNPNTNLNTLAIERDANGVFRIYLNDNLVGTGTDTTYTTNEYLGFRHTQNHKIHEMRVELIRNYELDILSSQTATPHTGSYSLAGSGDFQPEYAYFNRTAISLAGYTNVQLSVWYSYKDTTNTDKFGLFYKDGLTWIPIFNQTNINIGNGQSSWTQITTSIPDHIDNLILQFRWSTSSSDRYVMIDDLMLTGITPGGVNYQGFMDEIKLYTHELSEEQIYQNYLQIKKQSETGQKGIYVIVASETNIGDQWQCFITPNDGQKDYALIQTNTIIIGNYGGG
jgi:hypothetical protein